MHRSSNYTTNKAWQNHNKRNWLTTVWWSEQTSHWIGQREAPEDPGKKNNSGEEEWFIISNKVPKESNYLPVKKADWWSISRKLSIVSTPHKFHTDINRHHLNMRYIGQRFIQLKWLWQCNKMSSSKTYWWVRQAKCCHGSMDYVMRSLCFRLVPVSALPHLISQQPWMRASLYWGLVFGIHILQKESGDVAVWSNTLSASEWLNKIPA